MCSSSTDKSADKSATRIHEKPNDSTFIRDIHRQVGDSGPNVGFSRNFEWVGAFISSTSRSPPSAPSSSWVRAGPGGGAGGACLGLGFERLAVGVPLAGQWRANGGLVSEKREELVVS